ncbi:structure-specific endonuclease subunit SLX1 homolog [Anopheles ziemanni]|uniref:structure-specific endonuclease subunit SLX1 homolog n=1 Tax=Anopheles coustani TaxID=139045 RepID=UPI002658EBA9|nr:structure-specific endonuclease subunit SLX1 homolog [Anopheles coustani]XP_058172663.1 structure-specific endonuclease subunit SLX1 homolog [Anopheles ziemanni]
MDLVQEIEDFYGVYLLVSKSTNPKFAGRTYVGYTVDPNRRIKQHNGGQDAGGARRTSNRGPWIMVMIIHGFPNNISALRFEWAWQQPRVSRRMKQIPDIQKKLRNETYFEYHFRILSEMLRIGPWNRLPLIIRWLADEYHREFEIGKTPPLHMPICFGRIKKVNKKRKPTIVAKKASKEAGSLRTHTTVSNQEANEKIPINYDLDEFDRIVMGGEKIDDYISQSLDRPTVGDNNPADTIVISSDSDEEEHGGVEPAHSETNVECTLCRGSIDTRLPAEGSSEVVLRCLQPRCQLISHLECLARLVLEPGQYVPVEGDCPICETHFLWGDIIRKANGCCDLVDDVENVDPLEVNDVSDEDE